MLRSTKLLFKFGIYIHRGMKMISIDFEVNWSKVLVIVTFHNGAVGYGPTYTLCIW